MAELAKLLLSTPNEYAQVGVPFTVTVNASGNFALINGLPPTWTALQNCAIQSDGSLKDTAGGAFGHGVAGGVSSETIAAGDGFVEWLTTAPPANASIGYPFLGGRMFFAGLTSKASGVVSPADLDFAIQVYQGGVVIHEAGVVKINARAARPNASYRVGIEDGGIVYRADGEVIYRSSPGGLTYPLRFGVIFFHRSIDYIGGNPGAYSLNAYEESGEAITPVPFVGNVCTIPDYVNPQKVKIEALTSNYLSGSVVIDAMQMLDIIALRNSGGVALPCQTQFLELTPQYPGVEVVNANQSGLVNLPSKLAVLRFRLTFNKLPYQWGQWLDDFYDRHKGNGIPFMFKDWRHGNLIYDNCRIVRYEKDHRYYLKPKRVIEFQYRPRMRSGNQAGTGGGGGLPPVTGFVGSQFHYSARFTTGRVQDEKIPQLIDFSGSDNPGSQGIVNNQATYKLGALNGQPAFYFDGAQWYDLEDFMQGFTEGEMYAVFRVLADPAVNSETSGFFSLDREQQTQHFPYITGETYCDFGSFTRRNVGNLPGLLTDVTLINVVSEPNHWRFYHNGALITNDTGPNTVGFPEQPQIGREAGGFGTIFFKGYLGEFVFFPIVRTDQQRVAIWQSLAAAYQANWGM
jgi:hypothetical protein